MEMQKANDDAARAFWAKMHAIQERMAEVPQTGKGQAGSTQFSYHTDTDILQRLQPLLQDFGMVMVFEAGELRVEQHTKTDRKSGELVVQGARVMLQVRGRLVDVATGFQYESTAWGESDDSGNILTGKAYSNGIRHWMLNTFLIGAPNTSGRTRCGNVDEAVKYELALYRMSEDQVKALKEALSKQGRLLSEFLMANRFAQPKSFASAMRMVEKI